MKKPFFIAMLLPISCHMDHEKILTTNADSVLAQLNDKQIQLISREVDQKILMQDEKFLLEGDEIFRQVADEQFLKVGRVENEQAIFCQNDEGCDFLVEKLAAGNSLIENDSDLLAVRIVPRYIPSAVVDPLASYVMASPHQEDAGSCLYMASTGAVEILLNQKRQAEGTYDGDTDLSERFLMNAAVNYSGTNIANWRTDTLLAFNNAPGALLNRDFRYTKGWSKVNSSGQRVRADERTGSYSTLYNWVIDLSRNHESKMIDLPTIERKVLFSDSEKNQWNVGVMTPSIIDAIKQEIAVNKRPVVFLYNHNSYWHAVDIVGYDDEAESDNCSFVTRWFYYMRARVKDLENAGQYQSARQTQQLVDKAQKSQNTYGTCKNKGVFPVRDSINEGDRDLMYDYDPKKVGEEKPYSKKIITHSYEWALTLGNHAYSVYLK